MRDDARGENQSCLLRCGINRSQQTTSGDPGPARFRIDRNLAHFRQVNHHAAVARAKTCEAVSSAADGGKNSDFRGRSDCVLHIAHVCAAHDKAWGASYHCIPNDARVFVAAFAGAQQVTFESPD